MKPIYPLSMLGLALIITGCATSSQVQEAIEANQTDFSEKVEAHEASIEVLKKSAMAALERSKENAELIRAHQTLLNDLQKQLKLIESYAEASKVNSAANTVRLATLKEDLMANSEADALTKERLSKIDRLFEEVMISYYQAISENANQAMALLKASGSVASTNAPVDLDQPIEIATPDTAAPAPTNAPAVSE